MKTVLNVTLAEHMAGYRIKVRFDDLTEREIDFEPFLTRSAHPAIRAYLDPARFAAFRIECGELVWGDYDLCFPIIDLYRAEIDHTEPEQVAI